MPDTDSGTMRFQTMCGDLMESPFAVAGRDGERETRDGKLGFVDGRDCLRTMARRGKCASWLFEHDILIGRMTGNTAETK